MSLRTVVEHDLTFVEGPEGSVLVSSPNEIDTVLEACFNARTRLALLYAENLPAAFFDLSSQQAGSILQKLRNYGVRLAVIRGSQTAPMSRRFGELLAEERRGRAFAIFDARAAAVEWLRQC